MSQFSFNWQTWGYFLSVKIGACELCQFYRNKTVLFFVYKHCRVLICKKYSRELSITIQENKVPALFQKPGMVLGQTVPSSDVRKHTLPPPRPLAHEGDFFFFLEALS